MESSAPPMRFTGTPTVLKQPLLVLLTVVFTVGVLVAAFGPWGGGPDEVAAEPVAITVWHWLFWAVVLAGLLGGASLLCYGVEVVVDGQRQQVMQTHRLLHRVVATQTWRFADFTGVAVAIKLDTEHRGSAMPTGGATLANARTVNVRSFVLSLQRPDLVVQTPERRLTAPRHALTLPLDKNANSQEVEALARALAALGGWPAWRHHYVRQADGSVKVQADAREPISP